MNFDSHNQSEIDYVNPWRRWHHKGDLLELYVACHGTSHGTLIHLRLCQNRMCLLSIVHASYDGVNLKYELWPWMEFYKMSEIWHETGKTRITFVLIVHRFISEAANLCISKSTIFYIWVFNLPLEVVHYSNIADDRNQFHVQALMPDTAGWVWQSQVYKFMCWIL